MSRDHLSDGNKNGAFKKQFGFWVLQQQRPKAPYYVDVGCIVIYIGFGFTALGKNPGRRSYVIYIDIHIFVKLHLD